MRRAAYAALLLSLVTTFVSVGSPSMAVAQSRADQSRADLDSGESRERVYFVPRIAGALSIDASLMSPFHPGTDSGYPATWGFSAGWRQNFEGHGRVSLRSALVYEHGGLFDTALEGTSNRFGLTLSPALRFISTDWVFASFALLLDLSYLQFAPPASPFGAGTAPEKQNGWEFGVGVETTFGALFVLDPWIFAESGASVTMSRVTLGDADAWEVWARWVLRFDWAVPRTEQQPAVAPPP